LWIVTNNLPKVDPDDRAVWARLRAIPFNRRFLKPEDDGFDAANSFCTADDTLTDKILQHEREGVFAWLVEGCKEYLLAGQVPNPPESRELIARYRGLNDPVGEWIEETCEVAGECADDRMLLADDWVTPIAWLYSNYRAWIEVRGERPETCNSFARSLGAKGFPARKLGTEGARVRCGLHLRGSSVFTDTSGVVS
jgi:phage/plasmid-associated DNA primase